MNLQHKDWLFFINAASLCRVATSLSACGERRVNSIAMAFYAGGEGCP